MEFFKGTTGQWMMHPANLLGLKHCLTPKILGMSPSIYQVVCNKFYHTVPCLYKS